MASLGLRSPVPQFGRFTLKTYILRQGTEELRKVEGILYARDF
jgi:hypothetical protein